VTARDPTIRNEGENGHLTYLNIFPVIALRGNRWNLAPKTRPYGVIEYHASKQKTPRARIRAL
jgi:hypothetical protein